LSAIVRNTFFDPRRNMTTAFGDRLAGCMYDEQRAGPNGKHVHVWVPPGTTMDELRAIRATIVSERDLVSMSFDYWPTVPGGIFSAE
jgi:hypothetical protein